jgi:hypothetical protein
MAAKALRTASSFALTTSCKPATMKQGQGVEMSPNRLHSPLSWYGFVVNVSHMNACVVLAFTL